MANRIKVRRGNGKPTTSLLMQYELGWDTTNSILYISTGSDIVPTFTGVNDLSMGTTSLVNGRKLRFYSKDSDTTDTRHIWLGYANDHNRFYIYDATRLASIITSNADGTNTFNGNATNVSGTVAIANGGTGATTASAALTNLGALPLTGGTLTGNLTISKSSNPVLILKNTVMDTSALSLTDNAYDSIYFRDKDDRNIIYLEGLEDTNGRVRLTLAVRRRNSNNTDDLLLLFQMYMATDGTATTAFSHPGAWRDGLNVINKAGDTMTGNLIISHGNFPTLTILNTDIDTKASSLSAPEYSSIYFRDKNTDAVRLNGYILTYLEASGTVGFTIAARRMNSGNTNPLTNYLKLTMAADGTATIDVGNNAPAWRTTLNVVNKSGDNMTGTLTTSGSLIGAIVQSSNTIENTPLLRMCFSDKNNYIYGLIQTRRVDNYGGRIAFRQYSENSSGARTGGYESYILPTPAQGIPNNTGVIYGIITTPGDSPRRRLFVDENGNATVPAGAIDGDIVLVKVN